jgi:hypothetical protein
MRIELFVGKPEGKRPLGRTRSRWKDSIETDFREISCENCSASGYDQLANYQLPKTDILVKINIMRKRIKLTGSIKIHYIFVLRS